jgi:hypothetical protein
MKVVRTKKSDISLYNPEYVDCIMYNEELYPTYGYYHAEDTMCAIFVDIAVILAIESTLARAANTEAELNTAQKQLTKVREEISWLSEQLETAQKITTVDRITLIDLVNANLSTDNIIQLKHNGVI